MQICFNRGRQARSLNQPGLSATGETIIDTRMKVPQTEPSNQSSSSVGDSRYGIVKEQASVARAISLMKKAIRQWWPVLLLFALSVWTMAPALQQPANYLPVRPNLLTTVPLFNAWTIWWNADRLTHGFAGYWDSPIFFPAGSTFAFSEPQPATMIVAPVIWMTGSPTLAYNVYMLLSLFLNGVFTYRILRRTGSPPTLAVIGGAMMIWLPVSVRQLEVLQLIPVWSMLWTWDAVRRFGVTQTWRTALECAVAYALSFHICIHHTLFMTIALAATAWILCLRFRRPYASRTLKSFCVKSAVALILAAGLVSVVFVPMRKALRENSFERSQDLVGQLSAQPADLWITPYDSLLFPGTRLRFGFSPGWIKVALASLGVLLGTCHRKRRRWVLFLLLTTIVTAILAIGANLKLGDIQLWWSLAKYVPGISQVRNVFRFVYLTQMAIILLGMIALTEVWLRLRARRWRHLTSTVLVTIVALAALIEVPAPKPLLAGVPDLNRHVAWASFLKQNTPPGKAIACLPFPSGTAALDFDSTARWMYLGSLHGVPMINGYSGFFPPSYLKFQAQINKEGLSEDILTQLATTKTHFVVIHNTYKSSTPFPPTGNAGGQHAGHKLQLVFEDPIGIRIYELKDP